jgi:integrase
MHANPSPRVRPATGFIYLRSPKDPKRPGVWHCKFRTPDGTQVKRRLGTAWTGKGRPPSGYLTRKGAEDALAVLKKEADDGTLAVAVKTGLTFTACAHEFLRYVEVDRERDPATVRDYKGVVEGYLIPYFGDAPIEALDRDAIVAYRDKLKAEGRALRQVPDGEPKREGKLSNRVIVRHLVVLTGLFRRVRQTWKPEWGPLPDNPAGADVVDRPRVVYSGEFKVLTADEVRLLRAHAPDEQTGVLYLVAAFTGLRQGEIFALRWRDVDFSLARIHVRENYSGKELKRPKSQKVRSTLMSDDVIAALDKLSQREHWTGPDDLVFPGADGDHLGDMAVRRGFYRDLKAAGLRRVRFHDLRHTFGTVAAHSGMAPVALQAYMGHASYKTTERYLHHSPAIEDAAKLTAALGGELASSGNAPELERASDDEDRDPDDTEAKLTGSEDERAEHAEMVPGKVPNRANSAATERN